MYRGIANSEELTLIRDSIILPFMLDMVENERQKLENNQQPLQKLFLEIDMTVMKAIHSDLVKLRKELKQREIKVTEAQHSSFALNYDYWCRGYGSQFGILRETARSEISFRFGQYIAQVAAGIREKK